MDRPYNVTITNLPKQRQEGYVLLPGDQWSPLQSKSNQMRATPDFRAASATALATAGPTLGSKAAGII